MNSRSRSVPLPPMYSNPKPERLASTEVAGQTFMAFDFGIKRTGCAIGTRLLGTAQPLNTFSATGEALFERVACQIKAWQPDALVLGIPFYPDGTAHENTRRAKRFGRQLYGRFGLWVHEVDERYTTTEATSLGAKDLDAASACLIMEQFLRGLE